MLYMRLFGDYDISKSICSTHLFLRPHDSAEVGCSRVVHANGSRLSGELLDQVANCHPRWNGVRVHDLPG